LIACINLSQGCAAPNQGGAHGKHQVLPIDAAPVRVGCDDMRRF
jgi:hypothetical protein